MTTCRKRQVRRCPAARVSNPETGRLFAVNDRGDRIGEDHHKAVLTDNDVENMRKMHEEFPLGHAKHLGVRRLAAIFQIAKTSCRDILQYRIRAQVVVRFKRGV